ncbi:hypothetical protein NDU88_003165 [Pleurodeles waltl]|uniref:Uncharacterized protein n=1 Tax=Pleurodeles waltl TaxID=8319 RepID=A0AAV7RG12_PLEWA|nr:hypothetical protein NDU88_003165 [Pleurodeles waltl]
MGTGLRGVSSRYSKLKIRDSQGHSLVAQEGAASFSGVWTRGPRAARFTSAARDQWLGAQPCRPAAPCSAQVREPPPYSSPLFRFLSSPPAPASRGSSRLEESTEPAAPLPRPRGAPDRGAKSRRPLHRTRHARLRRPLQQASLRARPRLFSLGEGALASWLTFSGLPSSPSRTSITGPGSPRGIDENGRAAPLPAGGPRSRSLHQALRAPHAALPSEVAPSADKPRSPGLPRRRAPGRHFLKNCCSGRGQRSRLGLCRYWHQRSLRGPGARGSG